MSNHNHNGSVNGSANLGRHQRLCQICNKAEGERAEIEQAFVSWTSPATIAREYGLGNRSTVYRHADALDLVAKRSRNLRAVLERMLERADEAEVTASAVIQAVALYGRLNARGKLVEQSGQVGLQELFDQMSTEELEQYAKNGDLPAWVKEAMGSSGSSDPKRGKHD